MLFLIAPLPAVTVEVGELPIVISAPHGGRLRLKDVPDRTGGAVRAGTPKGSGFQTALDSGTDALATALADEIGKRLGKRPYLVVCNVTRKQFDANRPESIGVEHDGARPAYRRYHGALTRFRAEILRKYGSGLLLDIHGQGSTKDAIYRGTGNGSTVAGLPREMLVGEKGLLGVLEAKGIRLIPANKDEGKKESPGLNGGWIVRHYGASAQTEDGKTLDTPERFWAVQLECGIDFRRKAAIPKAAADMAEAVERFARTVFPEALKSSGTSGGNRR